MRLIFQYSVICWWCGRQILRYLLTDMTSNISTDTELVDQAAKVDSRHPTSDVKISR